MHHAQLKVTARRLKPESTADVCDACTDAGVFRLQFNSFGALDSCCGTVETVSTQNDNSIVQTALQEQGEGRILLIDNQGSMNCAMLGGNLARTAAGNEWQGIVINGAVRDANELRDAHIAIFALGTTPRRSFNRGVGSRDQSVRVGGLMVRCGDVLVADADGVVVLPAWVMNT